MILQITKYLLLAGGIGISVFAVIMGAESPVTLTSLFKNLPNAFAMVNYVNTNCRQFFLMKIIGGILVMLWGLALFLFFTLSGPNFWLFTTVLTASFVVLGMALVILKSRMNISVN